MRNFFSIVLFLISFLLFLISCEDSSLESINTKNLRLDKTGVIELQVDHYLTAAYGPFPGLFHVTQQGEQIENNHWQIQYDPITNFDYEWGYRYRLLVDKQKYEPQVMDGPAYEYEVMKVLSKSKVDQSEHFKVLLKQHYDVGGADNFLQEDGKKGYSIMNKDFDCGKLCDELSGIEKLDQTVIGIFEHAKDQRITLIGLETD